MGSSSPYPQFILLGDSLIQYSTRLHAQNDSEGRPVEQRNFSFGAALAEKVERRLDIVNRGFSGYNTSNILFILDSLIPKPEHAKVDYLLLLLGANDSCLETSLTNQHVALDEYRQNLKKIIEHDSIQKHNPTILLATPPPIHEFHLQEEDLKAGNGALTRKQKVTEQYARAAREVALEFHDKKVILVDLWKAMMDDVRAATPETDLPGSIRWGKNARLYELLVDGLHLSGESYKIFFEAVLVALGGSWLQNTVDREAWVFPRWNDAPRMPSAQEIRETIGIGGPL